MDTVRISRKIALSLFAAVAVFAAGCGSDDGPTGSGGGNVRPHFKQVSMQGNSFSPSTLTIVVGDTVLWTNRDGVQHTVTSTTGTELDSPLLSSNQVFQHIFTTAGSFGYSCTIHPGMTGSVTVQ